jgi:hypothetical protein
MDYQTGIEDMNPTITQDFMNTEMLTEIIAKQSI